MVLNNGCINFEKIYKLTEVSSGLNTIFFFIFFKGHELKLREMLIPKKRKRVYSKIKRGIKRRIHEEKKLNEKRLKILEAVN